MTAKRDDHQTAHTGVSDKKSSSSSGIGNPTKRFLEANMHMNQRTQIQIGTRIKYVGDVANLPGMGAVVAIEDDDCKIILEDGRAWYTPVRLMGIEEAVIRPASTRLLITAKPPATAEEVAALIANAAMIKAQAEASKAAEAEAYAAEVEALKADPKWGGHLEQGDDRYSGKLAAKNIRKELKRAFPGVKFSVRKERYGTVRIAWDDTRASVEAVEDLVRKYKGGHFDGMEDIYVHRKNAWATVFGGSDFVFCNGPH